MDRKVKLAVFDFDGTLINIDSFLLFIYHICDNNLIRFIRRISVYIPLIICAKIGLKEKANVKEIIIKSFFNKIDSCKLNEYYNNFKYRIDRYIISDVYDCMTRHITNGDRVVIVSASIYNWIAPWANERGVDAVLATELDIACNGKVAGFKTENCNGLEKVRRLKAYIYDNYHNNVEVVAYGNSVGDYPMLELADKSFLVITKLFSNRHEIVRYK